MDTQIDFRLPPAETADPADIRNFRQADADAVLGAYTWILK